MAQNGDGKGASDDKEASEGKAVTPTVRRSIASRLTETPLLDLPDDLRLKIREMASSLGKSEMEVYQELVVKGLASSSEDVAYILARRKVIDSLTPSERIQVLKNEEAYLKQMQSIFGTWTHTPTPTTTPATTVQPTASQPVSQASTPASPEGRPYLIPPEQVDKATQEMLRKSGLPDVSIPQPQGQGTQQPTSLSQGSILTLTLAKYAIDKLGTTAITSILNNPKIQESIADLLKKAVSDPRLQEIVGGLLGDLSKLKGEGNPP